MQKQTRSDGRFERSARFGLALFTGSLLAACSASVPSGSAAPPMPSAVPASTDRQESARSGSGLGAESGAPRPNVAAIEARTNQPPVPVPLSTAPTESARPAGSEQAARPKTSATSPLSTSSPASPVVPGGLARGTGDAFDRALFAADEAYAADDLARARVEYRRAERLSPNDPAARLGQLRVDLAASNVPTDYAIAPKDARMLRLFQQLDDLSRRHPSYGPVHVERGRVLLILGRAEPALEGLARGVELSPADPEAHSALGVALLATGKPKDAIPRFRRAVELDSESADRYRNLGTAQLMVGDVRPAIVAYQRAVLLAPDDARSHSDLGTALLALNAVDLALPELYRAIELDAKRATFRSNLAYASLLKGDLESAEREAREAVRLDPKLGSGFINLGTVQARRGEHDAAERSFRKALALDPTDPRAQASLEELETLRKKPR